MQKSALVQDIESRPFAGIAGVGPLMSDHCKPGFVEVASPDAIAFEVPDDKENTKIPTAVRNIRVSRTVPPELCCDSDRSRLAPQD